MAPVSYKIDTEIPASYTEKLLDFIHQKYLLLQKDRFTSISRKKTETGNFLSYAVRNAQGKPSIQVDVKASKPVELTITPIGEPVPETAI